MADGTRDSAQDTSKRLPKGWRCDHDQFGHVRYTHSNGTTTLQNPWYLLYDTEDHITELGALPEGWELRRSVYGNMRPLFHHALSNKTIITDPRCLPDRWELRVDPNNSRLYYVDHSTRSTHWEHPYTAKMVSEWVPPVPDGWDVGFTAEGKIYYVNHKSKTTQWQHPSNPQIIDLFVLSQSDEVGLHFTPSHSMLYWILTSTNDCYWVPPGEGERLANPNLLGALPTRCEIRMCSNFRYFIIDHTSRTTRWAESPLRLSSTTPAIDPDDGFGPLPLGYLKIITPDGYLAFVDQNTETASRVDPRHRPTPPTYSEAIVPLPTPNDQNPEYVQTQAQAVTNATMEQEPSDEPSDSEDESETKEEKVNVSFRYRELQRDEIRILDIHAASSHDAPIVCTLRCVYLSSNPIYDALSYTWGNQEHETKMVVDGQKFTIRENAEAALRRLRQPKETRAIWIDAICINQNDRTEKSFQLPLMTKIYEQAQQVCVWLGEETEGSTIAMEKLKKRNTSSKIASHIRKTEQKHGNLLLPLRHRFFRGGAFQDSANRTYEFHHGEIRELLSRPWWSRVWIMQEAIVAQKVLIMCGSDTLDWDDISHWRYLSRQETKSGTDIVNPFGLDTAPEFDILDGFYHTITDFRREWKENRCNASIYDLLFRFRHLGCANKRDRIYGFLGLAALSSEPRLKPSYKSTIREVYRSFAEAIIQHTGSLDVLNYKREWKDVPPPQIEILAYSMMDQAKYHDLFADVVDAEGKRPRKAWARLPDGWERKQEEKSFFYYDWNTKTSSETSPLKGKPPVLSQHVGEQKICPPGWQKTWDNLGKVIVYYAPDSSVEPVHTAAKHFKLPSWVPNWSKMTCRDPSALLEGDGIRLFSAGGSEKVQLPDGGHPDKLVIQGLEFDKIAQIADPWHPEHDNPPMSRKGIKVLQQWEELAMSEVASCPYGNSQARKTALWRTHIADYPGDQAAPELDRLLLECWYDKIGWSKSRPSYKDLAGKSIMRTAIIRTEYDSESVIAMRNYYLNLLQEKWSQELRDGKITEEELIDKRYKELKWTYREEISRYGVLAGRIHRVCSHRALFVTAKGYIGLAPWNARVGDVAAVLKGGKTPFLLCKRQRAGEYTLVGECYIYGIMGGEAFDPGQDMQDFTLV